jgi:DNA-binding CsgD family transcriptional regulator
MTPFSASQDISPRRSRNSIHAREEITLKDVPTVVKAILSSPFLDSNLAEIALEQLPGTVRAGVFRYEDGSYQGVTVIVVTSESTRAASDDLSVRFGLTPREAQVALLLARRLSAKEIARELGFTRFAAARHTEHVMLKLGVKSRRDVAALLASYAYNAA